MNKTDSYNIGHYRWSSLYPHVTAIATWQVHGPLDHGADW